MHSAPITLTFTTSFISCVQAIYLSSFQSRRETPLYAFADITLQISLRDIFNELVLWCDLSFPTCVILNVKGNKH